MMKNAETWKDTKIGYMEFFYGEKAKEWADTHDDRRVFVNMYNIIVEALESLDDEPNNFVCVAMNKQIREDREIMDEIVERFTVGKCANL